MRGTNRSGENRHPKPKFETETDAGSTREPSTSDGDADEDGDEDEGGPALSPPRARGPALCEGQPCCPRGTPRGSACRRGSCPSGRISCRRVFGVCSRLRLVAAGPVKVFRMFQCRICERASFRIVNRRIAEG